MTQCIPFAIERIRAGRYPGHAFAIGSALVLQAVLPALWFADGPSPLRVSGGTQNPVAPPADFLIRCWQPLVRRMGATLDMLCHGLLLPMALAGQGSFSTHRCTATWK